MATKNHKCEFCGKPIEIETYEWKDAKIDCRNEEQSKPELYATSDGITRAERLQESMETHYLWGRFYASAQNLIVDMIHSGITEYQAREKLIDSTEGLFTDGWQWIDTAVPCPDNQTWFQAIHRGNDNE